MFAWSLFYGTESENNVSFLGSHWEQVLPRKEGPGTWAGVNGVVLMTLPDLFCFSGGVHLFQFSPMELTMKLLGFRSV